MRPIYIVALVAAAVAASLCIRCSSDDGSGGPSLVAPSVSQLVDTWNAVRRTTASSTTSEWSDQNTDSADTAIMHIGPDFIYSYGKPQDSSCYCVDSIPYSVSGNQLIIEDTTGELSADAFQMTWSLQGQNLVLRTQADEQGTEDGVTYSYDFDMHATYAPYTGPRSAAAAARCRI